MPDMIIVESTNIEAIGYEEDTQELHIKFLSGGYYIYHGVPKEEYESLMAAQSKGRYLNREIKGVYNFTEQ